MAEKSETAVTSPQSVTNNYEWTLTAYEQQGNLWLSWSQSAPFRAQQDKIEVYTSWPSNPDSNAKAWTWADLDNTPWDSGLRWGSDWHCARIAQSPPNDGYVYVNQLITQENE